MSVTVATDLFCDGCGTWIRGCTGDRVRKRQARRVAKSYGWTWRVMKDFCTACSGVSQGTGEAQ